METNIELDPKILQKNLEITKLKHQVDKLTSDLVYHKEVARQSLAEKVFKPFMISVINEAHELIIKMNKDVLTIQKKRENEKDYESVNSLLRDLRRVIKFMKTKLIIEQDGVQ
tara:strand:- start:92 stop:430 length:339 start_codon:yes stop_codon:yes gene_type:complete